MSKKNKINKVGTPDTTETKLISTSAEMALSSIDKASDDSKSIEKIRELQEEVTYWYTYANQHMTRARNYLTFLYVDQWDTNLRSSRENLGKPTLTINKLVAIINGILGEFRTNTPALSVRAMDENISQDQIDWRTDLIRQIHYSSNANVHYQTGLKNSLETGWGGLRLDIEFESPDTFDQCLRIYPIEDYQTGFWDPAAQMANKSDGDYAGWCDLMSLDDFKEAYPKIENPQGSGNNYFYHWNVRDVVIVTNIYRKEHFKKTIAKLSDGSEMEIKKAKEKVLESEQAVAEWHKDEYAQLFSPEPQMLEIIETRSVMDYKIKFYRYVDTAILEQGEWPGKILPVIYVEGNSAVIDGERIPISYIQDVIDAQKFLNYVYSQIAYSILMSRKEQYLGTPDNFRDYEQMWRNPENVLGALIANRDPETKELPQKLDPGSFDHSLLDALNNSDDQIGKILGRYEENRGDQSNAMSGVAIDRRQKAGNLPVSMYIDNIERGIEQCGKVILELIPFVYNSQRKISVRDSKGQVKGIELNKPMGYQQNENGEMEQSIKNDATKGTYDVEVRVDGSYDEQRLNALGTLIDFGKAYPPFLQLIPDLIAENSGLENTQLLIERAKTLLPPDIKAQESGQPPPPPKQAPPDPKMMVEMQKMQLEQKKLQMQGMENQMKGQQMQAQLQQEQQKIQIQRLEALLKSHHEQQQIGIEKYKTDADLLKEHMSSNRAIMQEHMKLKHKAVK